LTFNTLFQLVADGDLARTSERLLLIPDLVNYYLSGHQGWEITNASTTQLLNRQREWDDELFEKFALSRHLVGDLVRPGEVLGPITSSSAVSQGVSSSTEVVAVASHDTASAVLAVPAQNENFAYISSGTWSLVGVELSEPLIDFAAFEAGYSNELGAFGRTRFLRNVMGFWLLQEVIREYALDGHDFDAATLTNDAQSISPRRYLVDAESDELLGPGHMRERLVAQCERLGTEVPSSAPEFTRCIIDSLALAYRRALRGISAVSGVRIDTVHIVGGGALNDVLCQLTADACATPVDAGPVEAAALGNALMQLAGLGHVDAELWSMRQLIRSSFPTTRFLPNRSDASAWDAADDILEAARS
jgi:rhamnulokinase